MSISSEAAEQTVRITLNGAETALRIAGDAAGHIARAVYEMLRDLERDAQRTEGQKRFEKMLERGDTLEIYEIGEREFPEFSAMAKRAGLEYTAVRDRNEPGTVFVMTRESDRDISGPLMRRTEILSSGPDKGSDTGRESSPAERTSLANEGEDRFLSSVSEGRTSGGPQRARSADRSGPSSRHAEGERISVRAKLRALREEDPVSTGEETLRRISGVLTKKENKER